MTWALALVLVCALDERAGAQPSTVVPLSEEEQVILASGSITPGERLGGAGLGLVVGFGTGQALQHRYRTRGWLFTLADTVLVVGAVTGYAGCLAEGGEYAWSDDSDVACPLLTASVLTLSAVRIWQVVDALAVPPIHNRRLREIRAKQNSQLRYLPTPPGWRSFVVPSGDGAGAVAGAAVAF